MSVDTSNNDLFEDDDFVDDEEDADTGRQPSRRANQPADLRKQNSKLARDLAAAQTELAKMRAEQRRGSVADLLEANGGKKSWAKYVDIEGDVNTETILQWLSTSGKEDFGWEPSEPDDEEEDGRQQQARRMSRLSRDATPTRDTGIDVNWLKSASVEDLIARGIIQK